jgi:hypothetical protein
VISDFGRLVVLALVLDQLDLGEIAAAYASDCGLPPFDPAMMTALLLYHIVHCAVAQGAI